MWFPYGRGGASYVKVHATYTCTCTYACTWYLDKYMQSACIEVRSVKSSEGSSFVSMLGTAALILLLAPLCLCAGKEPQSEKHIYKTKEWKDSSRLLILTKQSLL